MVFAGYASSFVIRNRCNSNNTISPSEGCTLPFDGAKMTFDKGETHAINAMAEPSGCSSGMIHDA